MILFFDETPQVRLGADGLVIIEIAPSRQAFAENLEVLPGRSPERVEIKMLPPAFALPHFGAAAFAFRCAPSEGNQLKPFFRESAAGWRFQIMFKFNGVFPDSKGKRCFYPPWAEFGCLRNVPGIVGLQTGLQFSGEAGVETFRVALALKNINVKKVHSSL